MPQTHSVIGFAGRARTGKDTAAEFLLAARGGYRYSFAEPLKAMLLPLGIDFRDPYWTTHKEDVIPALGVSPRFLMQTLGTEWGRNMVNPALWTLLAQQRLMRNGPGMIISDVRFEDEAAWVRKMGGIVVHMSRKDATKVQAHSSELDLFTHAEDFVINNEGSIEQLQAEVRRVFKA